jgi:hypothetical protein
LSQPELFSAIRSALFIGGMTVLPTRMLISDRLTQDAHAGLLPDDPQQWFEQQKAASLPEELDSAERAEVLDLIERASHAVAAAHFGPADVAALLSEARAPMPPCRGALVGLAADCLAVAMHHQCHVLLCEIGDFSATRDWRKKIWGGARSTADKLALFLPAIVSELEWLDFPKDRDRAKRFRELAHELNNLDFQEPSLGKSSWREGAIRLAKAYTKQVNAQAGWSRNGPAVRFLRLALDRAYPKCNASAGAIEMALSRNRSLIRIEQP